MLEKAWNDYDFFFVHFKYTDSRGEDGNFAEKVKMIEQFDSVVPRIMALKPTVLVVTGDHSTPAAMASHSWHPVPTLLAADTCRPDGCRSFGEREALRGGLGHFQAMYLMPLGHGPRRPLGEIRGIRRRRGDSISRALPRPRAAARGTGAGGNVDVASVPRAAARGRGSKNRGILFHSRKRIPCALLRHQSTSPLYPGHGTTAFSLHTGRGFQVIRVGFARGIIVNTLTAIIDIRLRQATTVGWKMRAVSRSSSL